MKTEERLLGADVAVALDEWHTLIVSKQRQKARERCQLIMDICKKLLLDIGQELGYDYTRDDALLFGILFHGLQNFTDLQINLAKLQYFPKTNTKKGCQTYHTLIERTWVHFIDAKERLEFAADRIESEEKLNWTLDQLVMVEQLFEKKFGPGMYMSPELYIKKEVCSVCQQDPRSCVHIPWYIYNGILCINRVLDFEIKCGTYVAIPKDRRCRVWPWRTTKKGSRMCFLTTFHMDAFLD